MHQCLEGNYSCARCVSAGAGGKKRKASVLDGDSASAELRRGALALLYRSRNVYEKGIAAEDAADVDALPEPPAIADISWKAWQLTQVG